VQRPGLCFLAGIETQLVYRLVVQSTEFGFRPANLNSDFIHRVKGGGLTYDALAGVDARAMEHAIVLFARDRVSPLSPVTNSLMPLSGFWPST